MTKMPMEPRGESVPPTMLKPSERCPGPFSNTTVRIWKVTSLFWRGNVQKLGWPSVLIAEGGANVKPFSHCARLAPGSEEEEQKQGEEQEEEKGEEQEKGEEE